MPKKTPPKRAETIEHPWAIVERMMKDKGISNDELRNNGIVFGETITPMIAARLEFMVGKTQKFWAEANLMWKQHNADTQA